MSSAEQIFLTLIVFVVFLILDLVWLLGSLLMKQTRAYDLWSHQTEADSDLSEVRAKFADLLLGAYGPKDLFVSHFRREINRLCKTISDVADKRELFMAADHFLNATNILDAFRADETKTWRYTWLIDSSTDLFADMHWRHYFHTTAEMVRHRKIANVRALLLFEDAADTANPRVRKLIDFFCAQSRMDCRLVLIQDYETICRQNKIGLKHPDIGIYGGTLLYLTHTYEPEPAGVFSRDPDIIAEHVRFFDSIWGSTGVAKVPTCPDDVRCTCDQLFEFDSGQPRPGSPGSG